MGKTAMLALETAIKTRPVAGFLLLERDCLDGKLVFCDDRGWSTPIEVIIDAGADDAAVEARRGARGPDCLYPARRKGLAPSCVVCTTGKS